MSAFHTKSVHLQDQVRRALRSGRYLPGDRIDPGSLASEFNTSLMPVRLALERLVGEGILEHQTRGGVYLPLPVEIELRDMYDWMQRPCLPNRTRPHGGHGNGSRKGCPGHLVPGECAAGS